MTRTSSILAALGLLIVSIAGGAFVASATSDGGDTTRALPRAEHSLIPVIGPSDGSLEPSDGASGGGGSAAGGGEADPEVSDPIGVVQEYDGDSGRPSVRFVDPCTDGEETDCEGIASTVLAIVDAPPFDIRYAGAGCNTEAARPDPFPLGWLVQVNTTTPGDFVFTLTDSDDPTNVQTTRASTSAAQAAEWEASERGLPFGVFTCAGFDLPNATNQFTLTIEGSHGAETDTLTMLVTHEGEGGRPPVQIDVPGVPHEDRLHVVVPAKHGDQGGVQVSLRAEREDLRPGREHGPSGRPGDPGLIPGLGGPNFGDACPPSRFDAITEADPTSPIPAAELEADGYPYDQGWDHRYEHTFTSFSAGGRYELCVFWLDGEQRIIEKIVYPVITPNRYSVSVLLRSVSFTHAQAPSRYVVETFNGGCSIGPGGDEPVRGVTYEPTDTEYFRSACFFDDELDTIPGSTFAAGSFEPMLRVEVTGGRNDVVAYLRLPLSSCRRPPGSFCGEYPYEYSHRTDSSTTTEDYAISLGPGSGGGLCGSSFGDCDPPREQVGTITLRIEFSETNRQGGRHWYVGPGVHITRV